MRGEPRLAYLRFRGLKAAAVPFLFKQWGSHSRYVPVIADPSRPDGHRPSWGHRSIWVEEATGRTVTSEAEVPATGDWQAMYPASKKAAGRELDGRTWDQFPAAERVAS